MDEAIERLLEAGDALARLTGYRVVVIGGVARGVWANPRATMDLDVILGSISLAEAIAVAGQAGLVAHEREVRALAKAGMTRLRLPDQPTGAVRMDVIAASHPYYERLVERSVAMPGRTHLRLVSLEDLLLLKCLADRPQDRADVVALLAGRPALDQDLIEREAEALELDLPETLRFQ